MQEFLETVFGFLFNHCSIFGTALLVGSLCHMTIFNVKTCKVQNEVFDDRLSCFSNDSGAISPRPGLKSGKIPTYVQEVEKEVLLLLFTLVYAWWFFHLKFLTFLLALAWTCVCNFSMSSFRERLNLFNF